MPRSLPILAAALLLALGSAPGSHAAAPTHWSLAEASVIAGAVAEIGEPDGCELHAEADRLTLDCGTTTIEVRTAAAPSIDAILSRQLERFRVAGARAVLLGSPECSFGADPLACTFVEARAESGRVGTAYVAAGGTGDRGFTVRCVYMSKDRAAEQQDPICSALLDRS